MKVYVVMGNDYPHSVHKTEEGAEAEVKIQKEKKPNHFPATVIYWRIYEFDLKE